MLAHVHSQLRVQADREHETGVGSVAEDGVGVTVNNGVGDGGEVVRVEVGRGGARRPIPGGVVGGRQAAEGGAGTEEADDGSTHGACRFGDEEGNGVAASLGIGVVMVSGSGDPAAARKAREGTVGRFPNGRRDAQDADGERLFGVAKGEATAIGGGGSAAVGCRAESEGGW